jgi:hypothetical protein
MSLLLLLLFPAQSIQIIPTNAASQNKELTSYISAAGLTWSTASFVKVYQLETKGSDTPELTCRASSHRNLHER